MKRLLLTAIILLAFAAPAHAQPDNWVRLACLNGQYDPWHGYYVIEEKWGTCMGLRLEAYQAQPFDRFTISITNMDSGEVWICWDMLMVYAPELREQGQHLDSTGWWGVPPGLYEVRLTGSIGLLRWTDVLYICP